MPSQQPQQTPTGGYQAPNPYPSAQQPGRGGSPQFADYSRPAAAPQKKSRKGLIITLIVILVVLLAGGGVAAYFITAPMRSYSKAMELKNSGDYEAASSIFADLGDYEDSADQITDCSYLSAKKLLDEGKFGEAKSAFEKLNGYKDSADLITKCDYGTAKELMDNQKYPEAKRAFEALGNYEDSKDQVKECDYQIAKEKVKTDPSAAIDELEELGDYKDCEQLLLDAKYQFCENSKDEYESLTIYSYMKELVAANYTGAKELYEEIYAYRVVDVFWNTDAKNHDKSSAMTEIPEDKDMVLHFTVEGGTPDDDMVVHYKVIWPTGETDTSHYDGHGSTFTLTLTKSPTGKLTVELYTDDDEKLATSSVTIV